MDVELHETGIEGFIITCCNCGAYVSEETREYGQEDDIYIEGMWLFKCLKCGHEWEW